ncbi:MAG TPA: TIGR03560 family F420-dependent LLM class oxidoreductase [Candidatus Dormibacteraeota bacterium]|jgi:F420-dependent oxidoreductase-like protein|nr:TIGR03560 family F420-dependent LLM class oxidoreductase [Candidatus Dormibacteraeota bacterium]
MRIGLDVAQHQLLWPELAERVQFAESAGFDGAWVFDHFSPLYGDPNGPCLEGWTLLAGLAAITSRIRLGVLVTGITYRHPSVLATEAITVDHISSGRLEMGVGAAWHQPEHEALGIPFPPIKERAERLEEGVQVIRLLMTKDRASFAGRHYQLRKASYHPRPIQRPHPPIWIGASGEQLMLPIVARQADAWHAFGSEDSMVRKSRLLDQLAEKAGRDPKAILRSASLSLSRPWDQVRRRVAQLREGGFGYLIADWPSEGKGRLDAFVEKVMPELTD